MTTPDHAGIRARLAAATPGNWLWGDNSEDGYPRVWVSGTRDGVADCFRDEDAEFIAYAPEDVRALLAENQRLRDTIQAAKAEAFETAFHALRDSGHSGGSIYVVETLMNEARAALGVSGE